MKLINVVLICLFIFSVSAFAKDDPVLSSFKKKVDVKCEISNINTDDLGEIVDFVLFDSIVVVNEIFQPYTFKYFNRNTGKKLGDFIRKGNGPNELNRTGGLEKYNDSLCVAFDATRKDLVYLNSNDILQKKYMFYKIVDFDNPELIIFKIYPISELNFLCTGLFEEGAYCLYNSKTKEYKVSIDFPVEEKHKNDNNQQKSMANQGQIALSPDKTKFVFVSRRGYIDFCKINNLDIELKKRNFYFSPEYKVSDKVYITSTKNTEYGFMNVLATEKYIYALYSGKTMDAGTIKANDILVYDWEGNPVVNFKTDRFIRNIKYDEKRSVFYSYSVNPVTALPEILTFKLPKQQ